MIFKKKNMSKEENTKDTQNKEQEEIEAKNGQDVNSSKEEQASEKEESKEETRLGEAESKIEELNDKYLRLYSEFENFRRRTAKERIELIGSAAGEIISDLLPILDDFDRAIESAKESKDVESIRKGQELIHQKIKNLLMQKGLKEMDAKEKEFDVELHEAVTKIPAPNKKLKGKVVDVVEKGYYLNEKVLRYAKVVVGE